MCVHPPEPQLAAGPRVDEPHCLSPEALDEFRATQVRGRADLQHGLAHRKQAACWEIIEAEVKVEVELITGQRHPAGPASDKLSHPRVHQRHLPLRVSRSVGRVRAAASEPAVPVQPGDLVQDRLGRQISLAGSRAADDQNEPATVVRGITDLTEPGRQTLT